MRPFLDPGDAVGVEWAPQGVPIALRLGELVLGREADRNWIVHRVVASGLIKGDAAFAWDNLTDRQIWAKVSGVRYGANGKTYRLSVNWLDRWIARFSRWAMPPEALRARISRKVVFLLGHFRRGTL